MSAEAGINLEPIFDQYLRDIRVPQLEYFFKEGAFYFRWGSTVQGFNMPLDVSFGNKKMRIFPIAGSWNSVSSNTKSFEIDPNYYISTLRAF